MSNEQANLNAFIGQLGKLEQPEAKPATQVDSSPAVIENDYRCATVRFEEVRHADRLLAHMSNQSVLWPGSLLQGASIPNGAFTPLAADRGPLKISVDLLNLKGDPRIELPEAGKGAYLNEINKILEQGVSGNVPAKMTMTSHIIDGTDTIALTLGVDVKAPIVEQINASYKWNDRRKRSRYIVNFLQEYFSVSVEPPAKPHRFFADTVTVADIDQQLAVKNPPLYVSQVSYGRQVIFTLESERTSEEIEAALNAAAKFGTAVDASTENSFKWSEALRDTSINSFIIGGDAAVAQKTSSYTELMAFIRGGDMVDPRYGVPVGFTLSYVADNSVAQIAFPSDYSVKKCEKLAQKVKVTLESLTLLDDGEGWGDEEDFYGQIWASGSAMDPTMMWEKQRVNYITLAEDAPRMINEAFVVPTSTATDAKLSLAFHFRVKGPTTETADRSIIKVLTLNREIGWNGTHTLVETTNGVTMKVTMRVETL